MGSFEVEPPILCSRSLCFDEKTFTCFGGDLPKKESPYNYDSLSTDKLTLCPHLHTTHAETECHIKSKQGLSILEKTQKFLSPLPTLVIEIPTHDGQLEVTLEQTQHCYFQALGKCPTHQLRYCNRIYKVALIKFLYSPNPDPATKNISRWPYLSVTSVLFLREKGFTCVAVNTPSFDNETSKDVENHHAFFDGTDRHLVIEFVEAKNVAAGPYIAELAVYPVDSDSAPCAIKMKKIVSAHLIENTPESMSD